eukprot:CAMPEP_0169285470 /NCGR_PEP_ID=MMETSP1016-20121227/58719_1 /TAXON_ID=342587 /ORGANISM="Karlodinium micrum, Strain CCMP2283" /LENGTH=62 /DNA_ID=CAMNT_0009374987 /DNA_START=378 /DNA_END=566 /DNA_ORIENTATION=+
MISPKADNFFNTFSNNCVSLPKTPLSSPMSLTLSESSVDNLPAIVTTVSKILEAAFFTPVIK